VNVRYKRDFRSDIDALNRVLVSGKETASSAQRIGRDSFSSGASMIRNENGLLTGYVYVDIADRDPESYVEEAARCCART